jgi:carbamoyl-phosphate synthase large subunit
LADLIISIPEIAAVKVSPEGFKVRRTAIDLGLSLLTDMSLTKRLIHAFSLYYKEDINILAWSDYLGGNYTKVLRAINSKSAPTFGSKKKKHEALNLFIRQPFTQSGKDEQNIVQSILDTIETMNGKAAEFNYLTGCTAQNKDTFRKAFEKDTGLLFSPKSFREYRLKLLDAADAFINIRTGMSESGSFELAYHIFKGTQAPVFFACWKGAPIHTTLLRELHDLVDITYVEFESPDELTGKLFEFFEKVSNQASGYDEIVSSIVA